MNHTSKAPPIEGFHHITLPVSDLDEEERFYVGLLGAKLFRKFDREAFSKLRPGRVVDLDEDTGPLHLSVTVGDGPKLDLFLQRSLSKSIPTAHPHFAMRVDPDHLDVFIYRLKAAEVPYDGPRRLGVPGQASVYFTDPFCNLLELIAMGYTGSVTEGPPDANRLARWNRSDSLNQLCEWSR